MVSLSTSMRSYGFDGDNDEHLRIPGIWSKLGSLYNLNVINEREDASLDYDQGDDKYLDFKLPDEEFALETFMRGKRSPSKAPSSPPAMDRSPSPKGARKRKRAGTTNTNKVRASTVEDTDEPKTSPPNSPVPKATRAGRSTQRAKGRAKAESGSRAESKDTAADEEDEEDEEEETEGVADEAEEDEEETGTPSPKSSKEKAKVDAPTTRKSRRKR
jgi:MRG-binding protein